MAEEDLSRAARLEPRALEEKLARLQRFLSRRDGRVYLTQEGRLVSNAVLADLLPLDSAPAVA